MLKLGNKRRGNLDVMAAQIPFSVSIRTYGQKSSVHWHDFAQLVLPLSGSLAIDIAGKQGVLDRQLAAYVETGQRHAQESSSANRSLILEFQATELQPRLAERWGRSPLLCLSNEINSLVDYMDLSLARGRVPGSRARLWAGLLFDSFLGDEPGANSKLAVLLDRIDANPASAWTAASMAAVAGVSVSRLHALFREELNTTPQAWVRDLRLGRVKEWLGTTSLSIAEIAYRAGYADQSALTRAMREVTGLTPAAYRRRSQESATKDREP
jgi:AraC-like DNA-binding protein